MMFEAIGHQIEKIVPKKVELRKHSDVMLLEMHQRLNPRPGGRGREIPEFWRKLKAL